MGFGLGTRNPELKNARHPETHMSAKNREIVERANAFVAEGKSKEFSMLFTEDAEWTMVAETPSRVKGRAAICAHLASASDAGLGPPVFTIDNVVSEREIVVANGEMSMTTIDGKTAPYEFCDLYRFRDNKIAELRTFINKARALTASKRSAAA